MIFAHRAVLVKLLNDDTIGLKNWHECQSYETKQDATFMNGYVNNMAIGASNEKGMVFDAALMKWMVIK